MQIFNHCMYEYEKGLRNLILYHATTDELDCLITKLNRKNITYCIYEQDNKKVKVFFGQAICVDIIKAIGKNRIEDYTEEQKFLLGIMLGYECLKQCHLFLEETKIG